MQRASAAQRREAGQAPRRHRAGTTQGGLLPRLPTARTLPTAVASETLHGSLYFPNPSASLWLHCVGERCERKEKSLWLRLASCPSLGLVIWIYLLLFLFSVLLLLLSWTGRVFWNTSGVYLETTHPEKSRTGYWFRRNRGWSLFGHIFIRIHSPDLTLWDIHFQGK